MISSKNQERDIVPITKLRKVFFALLALLLNLSLVSMAGAVTLTTFELQGSLGVLFTRTDTNPNSFRFNFGIPPESPVNFQFIYNHQEHSGKLLAKVQGTINDANNFTQKISNSPVSMRLEMNYTGLSPYKTESGPYKDGIILGRNYPTNPPEFIADGSGFLELDTPFLYNGTRTARIELVDKYLMGSFLHAIELARAGRDPFNVAVDLLPDSPIGVRGWFSSPTGSHIFSPTNYYAFSGDFHARIVGSRTEVIAGSGVPEPTSLALLAIGALGAAVRRRTKTDCNAELCSAKPDSSY